MGETKLRITDSLRTALLHLRLADRTRTLWVDQICINQDNVDERGHQVTQMGRVYRQAQIDLVWLGEEDKYSPIAFRWVKQTHAALLAAKRRPKSTGQHVSPNSPRIGDSTEEELEALRETFLIRSIWSRVWIVQEIVLSRDVILICGADSLLWPHLELVMRNLNDTVSESQDAGYEVPQLDLFLTCYQPMALAGWRTQVRYPPRPPLQKLLFSFDSWNATDKRDKVYALLGLAEDIGLVPDYTKPTQQVFLETVASILACTGNLNFICQDSIDDPSKMAPLQPSWIPCLNSDSFTLDHMARPPRYKAGVSPVFGKESFTVNDNILVANGYHVDCINSVDDSLDDESWPRLEWHLQLLRSIPASFIAEEGFEDDTTRCDIIWRTLLQDTNVFESRVSANEASEYRQRFLAWYRALRSNRKPAHSDFLTALETRSKWRRLALAEKHQLVVSVGVWARAGDEICVLQTGSVPVVVRKMEGDGTRYCLVGTAYVHGLMDGEAMQDEDTYPRRVYNII
ncbi:hypothetical protein BU26DRAFT_519534 [Trematosphaeria pertusa]|uniref:Heterokaryon incompatibility domain-containing protein n=1 Tax=Trematosphaeria pertusa TaxID=390896 RepID=A0A6A6IHU8_9PLEO|nr:uncharacterized protein BU26DRAFT_519534 [Trematosphaeria pertusa]KAF2249482.1 hypothetical protein BU26DRAFT_519534 [Trematosphaeria pertusa]